VRQSRWSARCGRRSTRRLDDPPAARTILSVGLQVGQRHAEIAALTFGYLHRNSDLDALVISPQAARIRTYIV
jgi:hypothetical protein